MRKGVKDSASMNRDSGTQGMNLAIDKWFPHGYDISRPSSSDQSISDALLVQRQQHEEIKAGLPNDGTQTDWKGNRLTRLGMGWALCPCGGFSICSCVI